MIKETLFKQAWWVSLAVVLAVLQIVFAVATAGDPDASATERLVSFSVLGGSAALAFIGVQQRPRNRRIGDVFIALGVVPAVLGGIIFFWFPPLWLTTAAGLVVMVFSISDAISPAGGATT